MIRLAALALLLASLLGLPTTATAAPVAAPAAFCPHPPPCRF